MIVARNNIFFKKNDARYVGENSNAEDETVASTQVDKHAKEHDEWATAVTESVS